MVLLRGGMLDGVPAERDGLVGTAGETAFAFGQEAAGLRVKKCVRNRGFSRIDL